MSDYLAQSDPGQRILGRCDELATISLPGAGVTRLYLTDEHRAAMALVEDWMREVGMEVHTDQAANVVGRYPPTKRESGYLLIGSQIDSVIDAGKYDRPLGVITAIDCVAALHRDKRRLPFGGALRARADRSTGQCGEEMRDHAAPSAE
jgi:allantoate deiminase